MSEQTTAVVPFEAIKSMANMIVKSRLFNLQNDEQAVSLMLLCQAENIHPMKAVQRYHIIQGKPAMRSDAMLGDFISKGGKVEWHERSAEKASATFYSNGCPKGLKITWTMDDAETAGVAGKDNWKKYPRQMLSARVISEGVRATDPATTQGLYVPEEIQDFVSVEVPVNPPVNEVSEKLLPPVAEAEPTPPVDPPPEPSEKPTTKSGCISEKQAKRMFAIAAKNNVSIPTIKRQLEALGIEHSNEIQKGKQYDEIIAWIEAGGQEPPTDDVKS